VGFENLLYAFDLLGVFVFAISGALNGVRKRMDIFGMLVLAVTTASGGGTLRSILIGDHPVPFLRDPNYLLTAALATLITYTFRKFFRQHRQALLFFDAFGLGIFLSIGVTVALQHGLSYWASILLGVVTAAFGGIIRDALSAEVPLIFRKELYATAAFIGGLVFVGLLHFHIVGQEATIILSALTVFTVRQLSIKYDWSLPR
jgi:uncharacterized membrane protein YeiH